MNAKPRAFEPHRLFDAVRAKLSTLLAVGLVALFGGGLVGRLAVPNVQLAEATAGIASEPHAVFERALQDDVLERARQRAGSALALTTLRERTRLGFEGHDRLHVQVRAPEADLRSRALGRAAASASTRRLADALAETYVALANERLVQAASARRQQRERQREQAQAAEDSARGALAAALAGEGAPDLVGELATAHAELAALEAAASEAHVEANVDGERVTALHELAQDARRREQALAQAQRELSRRLASGPQQAADVDALRARLRALQEQRLPLAPVGRLQVEARAQGVRARGLSQRAAQKRAELARLDAIAARVDPLRVRLGQTQAQLLELAAEARKDTSALPRSQVLKHAELSTVEPRGLRLFVSLLAPAIAMLALALFYALRELPGLRVREATELAHWLGVPVLTSSAWPARSDALEALVDALADPAIDALGTTLLLPLTELERPLAATLVAQLNGRAQRHYRSPTGSRVTIAQDWQGELDSARIRRASEVADRVLWVVASDVHHGQTVAARRSLLGPGLRVAALLLDAEPGTVRSSAARTGSGQDFWVPRPVSEAELTELPPGAVVSTTPVQLH